MRICLFLISCFLWFLPATISHSAGLPDDMVGYWALPDCKIAERRVIHSRFFALHLTDSHIWIEPVVIDGKGEDYEILHTGGLQYPVRSYNDGVLEIGVLSGDILEVPKGQSWESLKIDKRREYMRCVSFGDSQDEFGIETMTHIDQIYKQCHLADGSKGNKCVKSIFKEFDKNKNKALSLKELEQALQSFIYIEKLSQHRRIRHRNLSRNVASSERHIPMIIDAVMDKFDKDKSGTLERTELEGEVIDLSQIPDAFFLDEMVSQLKSYFY